MYVFVAACGYVECMPHSLQWFCYYISCWFCTQLSHVHALKQISMRGMADDMQRYNIVINVDMQMKSNSVCVQINGISNGMQGLVQQWENQKKEKRGMLKHISRLQLSRSDLLQTLQSISGSPLMGGIGGGGGEGGGGGGVRETSFSSSVHEEELSNGGE